MNKKNQEVLDHLFPIVTSEMIMLVSYESLLFIDNLKRDKIMLEVKLIDIISIMGKKDSLRLVFSIN